MIVVVISNTNSNSSYKLNSNSSCNIVVVILERTRGIQVASSPPAEGKSLICKPHASLANEAVIALVAAASVKLQPCSLSLTYASAGMVVMRKRVARLKVRCGEQAGDQTSTIQLSRKLWASSPYLFRFQSSPWHRLYELW